MWGKIIAVATVMISACPGQDAASCINPPHLQFAELLDAYLVEQNFEVGSHITYRCLPGYTFNNSESVSISCQSNLNWSEPLFHCVAIDCGPPEHIQNGTYIAPDHSFGLTATYSCNVGFVIMGRTVRLCTAQGWSGRLPKCQRVRCLNPEPVANGKIKAGFRKLYLYQNSIEYECVAGHQLFGDSVNTCTSRGIWDLPLPTCHPISSTTVYNENLINTVASTTIDGIIDQTTASFQQPRATSTVGCNNSLDNYPGSFAASQKWEYFGLLGLIPIIVAGCIIALIVEKFYCRRHGSYNTKSKFAVYPKDVEQSDVKAQKVRGPCKPSPEKGKEANHGGFIQRRAKSADQ